MCDPITFMLIAAGTSVVGQIQQGQQQKKMFNAQAQQALNDGAYREDAARAQAEKIRRAGRSQVGETRAALAASGVKLGEGTALELRKTVEQRVEEDALTEILGGKRASSSAQQEASLLGKAGRNAVTNSVLGAVSTAASAGWKIKKAGS